VTIPSSVTSIGSSAFSGCVHLRYAEEDNALYLGNKANKYYALISPKKKSLVSCNINHKTKIIAEGAFSDCTSLSLLTIGDSVATIGNSAFSGCSGLNSVTIPSSVISIGDRSFYGCDGLSHVWYLGIRDPGNSSTETFDACPSLTDVVVPYNYEDEGFCGITSFTKEEEPVSSSESEESEPESSSSSSKKSSSSSKSSSTPESSSSSKKSSSSEIKLNSESSSSSAGSLAKISVSALVTLATVIFAVMLI